MSYIFKQKLNLADLVNWQVPQMKVIVAVGDGYLRDLYIQHLRQQAFEAISCPSVDAVHGHIVAYRPHLLLYHIGDDVGYQITVPRLILLRKAHPQLKIVTIGAITTLDKLKKIMDTGVSSHIERKFSRPQDIVEVIKIILNA